jgi:hypothetical protein
MNPSSQRSRWQFPAFLAAEACLYLSYRHHDSSFHWFLHFFVGASFVLISMAIFTYGSGRTVRLPLLWILGGHVIAMIPDILWNFEFMAHQSWMDIFLLHITSHFIPGRNWTWYVVFLASLWLYLFARATCEGDSTATIHARVDGS